MGNICDTCCKGGRQSSKKQHPPQQQDARNSVRVLGIPVPLDDDWADEIWYDAEQYHALSKDEQDNEQDDEDEDDDETESLVDHDHHAHKKEQVFQVSQEELSTLKNELAAKFPNDATYMSDAYLRSVASKPYSKNMSIRRPLEYTLEKLIHVMEWRREMSASEMPLWIDVVSLRNTQTILEKETLQRAQNMVQSLNNGSMYWHGLTKEGRPILWIRTARKFWYPNVQAEVDALIAMADLGIQYGTPKGVTDFECISHSHKPPPPNPKFAFQMLKGLVKGYPDRMHQLISAPVSSIVEFCMNLLLPLMPGRLAQKFSFYNLDHVQTKLQDMLWHGHDDIPTFMGGPCEDHDVYYPEEKNCPCQGGTLKFDWYGMMERLQTQKQLFEQEQQQQQKLQQEEQGPSPTKETSHYPHVGSSHLEIS